MQSNKLPAFFQKILVVRRKIRINQALSKVTKTPEMKIIDIGCGIDGRSFEDFIPLNWQVVGVDLQDEEQINHTHPKFRYIKQDATDLSQFGDKKFDLAISIGMLEHITEEAAFKKIVSEIKRVAKQYIVIVPYKYCWIEPHYGIPFFPLYPYSKQLQLVKIFNLSNHRETVRKDPSYIRKNYMWLSNSEYQKHFPEAHIYLSPTADTIAIVKERRSHMIRL